MWLLTCLMAWADTDAGFLGVGATLPAWGTTGVPVDANVVVFPGRWTYASSYTEGSSWRLIVRDADDRALADSEVDVWPDGAPVVLTPPGTWPPDAVLMLDVDPGFDGVDFTTGTGHVQGLTGAPEIASIDVARARGTATLVRLDVLPADDPDALSYLQVTTSAGEAYAIASGRTSLAVSGPPDREVCVEVVQIDGLGRGTAPVEACAEAHGCATGPSAGVWTVVLAAAALRRRRRVVGRVAMAVGLALTSACGSRDCPGACIEQRRIDRSPDDLANALASCDAALNCEVFRCDSATHGALVGISSGDGFGGSVAYFTEATGEKLGTLAYSDYPAFCGGRSGSGWAGSPVCDCGEERPY